MNENNGANVEEVHGKGKRNKYKIILMFIIAIIISVGLIENVEKYIFGANKDEYIPKVEEYLENKYNEKFNIKFIKTAYKKKVWDTGAGSAVFYGKDKKIIGCIYEFSPQDDESIVCYIAYWYEKDKGQYEINEIYSGEEISISNKKVEPYSEYQNNNQMLEIEEILKKDLKDEYDYKRKSSYRAIEVKTHKRLIDIMKNKRYDFNDLYNKTFQLSKDKNVRITFLYKDYNIRFGYDDIELFTTGENDYRKLESKSFDYARELVLYLEKLLNGQIEWPN